MRAQLSDFYGNYASEDEVAQTIARIYGQEHYVLDTHTAVAASVYGKYKAASGDGTVTVIASTASPYKFARSVLHAIDGAKYDGMTDLEQIDALAEVSGVKVPGAIERDPDSSGTPSQRGRCGRHGRCSKADPGPEVKENG